MHGLCYVSGAAMADYQTQYQALGSCDEDDTDETDAPTHESANLMIHVVPESSMSHVVLYINSIFLFSFLVECWSLALLAIVIIIILYHYHMQ